MKILRVPLVLLALLLAISLPTGVQAAKMPNRPTALAVGTIDDQTSVLIWSGSAGTFRARAIKLNRRGAIRPSTSRTCTAELSQAGPGRCAVARLSPGRWQIRVTHVTSGGAAIRTKIIVVPLMSGFPTGFAPCAGNAETVKQAAYNCLRDWKPGPHPPATLVYHFSPSVSTQMQNKVKQAAEFTLDYATPTLKLLGYEPTYHIFVNGEGVESAAGRAWCKQAALSYAGTATQDWLWNSPQQSGACTEEGAGGRGNPSTIPGHATGWITTGPYGWAGGEDFWVFEVLPWEMWGVQRQYFKTIVPEAPGVNEVQQRWVQYLGAAVGSAAAVQLLGRDVDAVHPRIWEHEYWGNRAVTWQPTYHGWLCPENDSPRAQSCGVAQDLPAAEAALPWNYTLYNYAREYVLAKFGPAWIQEQLWPALAAEYGGQNSDYYEDMDRVAYRLWGGTWGDIEEALDTYLISELKAEGYTGLK